MQEDPVEIHYSPQQIKKLTAQFRENKQVMLDILRAAPKVGAYKGETKEDWNNFFKFFINFLKSQIGPRGQCAKKVRKQLKKDEAEVDKLLAPFGMTSSTHIREINMRIKNYIPCPEYTQQKKLEEARDRFIENITRFEDPNSSMVKAISEGMIKKHGKDYPVEKELNLLKENYIKKLKDVNAEIAQTQEVLDKCQGYHHLVRAQNYLKPYFQEWKHADSEIGKENIKTGQNFETTVFKETLPYLVTRQKLTPNWYYQHQKIEVFTNASWIPKNVGEIDIALGFKDKQQDRFFITTLIQCKSRLFDLREAHKQVSLQNNGDINKGPTFEQLKKNKKLKLEKMRSKQSSNKNEKVAVELQKQVKQEKTEEVKEAKQEKQLEPVKKFLSTKYGPAELVPNHHFYIITTLPHNEFVLPIESKMKQGIQKFTKNMFVEDIESQPFYESLRERFKEVLSPLEWLEEYQKQFQPNQSNILVLK